MKVYNRSKNKMEASDYGMTIIHFESYPNINRLDAEFVKKCVNSNIRKMYTYSALESCLLDHLPFESLATGLKLALICIPNNDAFKALSKYIITDDLLLIKKLHIIYNNIISDNSNYSLNKIFINHVKEIYSHNKYPEYNEILYDFIEKTSEDLRSMVTKDTFIHGNMDTEPFIVSYDVYDIVFNDIISNKICSYSDIEENLSAYFINLFIRAYNTDIEMYKWMLTKNKKYFIDVNGRIKHKWNKLCDIYNIFKNYPAYEEDYTYRSSLNVEDGIPHYYELLDCLNFSTNQEENMKKIHEYGINNMITPGSNNVKNIMVLLDNFMINLITLDEVKDSLINNKIGLDVELKNINTVIDKSAKSLQSLYEKFNSYVFISPSIYSYSFSIKKLNRVVNILKKYIKDERSRLAKIEKEEKMNDEEYIKINKNKTENIQAAKRIKEFIESEYTTVKYFYKDKYPEISESSDKNIVQSFFPEIYIKYKEKVEKCQSIRYASNISILDNIYKNIQEYGYYNIDLIQFMRLAKNTHIDTYVKSVSNINAKSAIFIKRYFYKNYSKFYRRNFYLTNAFEENISYTDGTSVSDEEKIAAFDYMKKNNLPYIRYVYSVLIRLIHTGELDLNIPFIENDIFLPSKERK